MRGVSEDLPGQFRGRTNTEAVCAAADRQTAELEAALEQIRLTGDTETATGKQLDRLGDILCLTRAQAALLGDRTQIYYEVLEDDVYRKYLRYKALKNTAACTYETLMRSVREVLGEDAAVGYAEDESLPATVLLTVGSGTGSVEAMPPIKPAGVRIYFTRSRETLISLSCEATAYRDGEILECGQHLCGAHACGEYNAAGEEDPCGVW